jgi:tristetraprolin
MNSRASIRPTTIKDSSGWFHPINSISRKACHRYCNFYRPRVEFSLQKTAKTTTTTTTSEMTNRWIVNGIGQYIDADAVVDPSTTTAPAPPWGTEDDGTTLTAGHSNSGLSDDLARLKISAKSEADAQLEPPSRLSRPSSKLTNSSAAAVAQTTAENNVNNTSSPLDSSSSNSSSSPHTPDHTLLHHPISHSRGASADTPHHHHVLPQTYIASQHSHQSNPSSGNNRNTNLLTHHQHALKTSTISTADSSKERPRSFSGSISTTDHRRLSQGGPAASPITDDHDRQPQSPWGQEQLSYPSLATQQQRPFHHNFNYSASNDINTTTTTDDDQHYTRAFSSVPPPQAQPHPHQLPASRAQFIPVSSQARPVPVNYRRTYTPQGPSPLGYGHHTTHHSLGNTQQLYEMMLPAGLGDAHHLSSSLSRGVGLGGLGAAGGNGIQQSPVFRATHHHSASDPSALRDPTTLALLNNNMQTFAPGMFQPGMHTMHPPAPPPPSIYPGQYYAQEMAMQQLLNARIQAAQAYTGPYGMATALSTATVSTPQPTMSMDNVNSGLASPGSSNGGNGGGPSANNRKLGLYKTELCRSWEEKGSCRYGAKCQFAHGEEELRRVARHPKVPDFPTNCV